MASRRPAGTRQDTIGQDVGAALDAMVEPMKSAAGSMREAVTTAVSGISGFMKEPADAASRQAASAARVAARSIEPAPRPRTRRRARPVRRTASKVRRTASKAKAAARKTARKTARAASRTGSPRRG